VLVSLEHLLQILERGEISEHGVEAILNQVHSAGRQLGRISAVLDVLLDAVAGNDALTTPSGSTAVGAFRQMESDIEAAKREYGSDRFITELTALKRDDPESYTELAGRLRTLLDAP
jgi:hypothetical protein